MAFTNHFVIKGRLNGLNEYTEACRKSKFAGARMKKENQQVVRLYGQNAILKSQLRKVTNFPALFEITWYEPNANRDYDNIVFAKKFILDALVELKILPDDSLKYVRRANDEVKIDKENPRIEVVIKEINDYGEQQNEN